jgi:predicted RNA-binding Zn ribbon-like protein
MLQTEFRFYLGSLSLNFVATYGRSGEPFERIPSPQSFGKWLRSADLIDSFVSPTAEQYARALRLREATYRIAVAVLEKTTPKRADIALLNEAAALGAPALRLNARTLQTVYRSDEAVDGGLAQIAIDAIAILGSATERRRLGWCDRCRALLLSSARGRTRRWCSMQICGNREKAKSLRERQKA